MAIETVQRQPRAIQWEVNGLRLAGLCWGEVGQKPLFALHGWLDNAASFSRLAPLFTDHYVVALDLTGHGRSDRRSADANYHIWDDLPEILGVIESLGWEQFDLIGHSRGAIISALLASAYPERVGRLVLLDAVAPPALAQEKFPQQLRKALADKQRLLMRANRVFPAVADAVAVRQARGLSADAATLLVERSVRRCEGGFTWTTDPRLNGASAVKLTDGQIDAALSALTMPTLLLLAKEEKYRIPEMEAYASTRIKDLQVLHVEGGHHFHMQEGVDWAARRVQCFLHGLKLKEIG